MGKGKGRSFYRRGNYMGGFVLARLVSMYVTLVGLFY